MPNKLNRRRRREGELPQRDEGSAELRAALSLGEAVITLDILAAARLNSLSDEFVEPADPDAVMQILVPVGLATKVSDALDGCSLELLKKFVMIDVESEARRVAQVATEAAPWGPVNAS